MSDELYEAIRNIVHDVLPDRAVLDDRIADLERQLAEAQAENAHLRDELETARVALQALSPRQPRVSTGGKGD